MFDPTAYENIKVVLEGLVYDHDLAGDIKVIERNDFINLADLSRQFNMTFTHKRDRKQILKIKMELKSDFRQLASEWVAMPVEPGADLSVQFIITDTLNEILEKRILKLFKQGPVRDYDFETFKLIYSDQQTVYFYNFTKFDTITEQTMDGLESIIDQTLHAGHTLYQMLQC